MKSLTEAVKDSVNRHFSGVVCHRDRGTPRVLLRAWGKLWEQDNEGRLREPTFTVDEVTADCWEAIDDV